MATTEPTEADWLEGNDPMTTRERFEKATTNEYTPTTDEVREAISEWAWSRRMWRADLGASDGQEADRWLRKMRAQTKADALDEAAGEVLVSEWWSDRAVNEYGNAAPAVRAWLRARAAAIQAAVSHPEPTEEANHERA